MGVAVGGVKGGEAGSAKGRGKRGGSTRSVDGVSATIVAVCTPPGEGGVGIVRLSGCEALGIGRRLFRCRPELGKRPRQVRLGEVRVGGEVVDSALGWFLPGPGSYTGEDTVEVCCHGSPVVLSAVVDAAVGLGARVAAGGEFTLRAFLNGRMDLAQAESVVSVVRAGSLAEAAAAVGGLNGGVKALAVRLQGGLVEVGARLEAALDFADEEGVSGALEGVGGAMVGLEEEAARALAGDAGVGPRLYRFRPPAGRARDTIRPG